MSLKVVKFDTKMYLNVSNFRGQTSTGGGQALVQKWGQVSDGGGGLAKFSPGKNPGELSTELSDITETYEESKHDA